MPWLHIVKFGIQTNDYSYSFPSGVTLNAEEKEIYADYYGDIESYVRK